MILQTPWALLGVVILILALLLHRHLKVDSASSAFSSVDHLGSTGASWKTRLSRLAPWLRYISLLLLIIALARPAIPVYRSRVEGTGIDIVVALDVSSSMLAADLSLGDSPQSRIDAARSVVDDFVKHRPADRIGVVVFAQRAYTLAPITWDHDWIVQRLSEAKVGMMDDGTAIGSALITAMNRLKDSTAKSKVIILLTDGRNNAGEVPPETAAAAAAALGIKVYTIGAGSKGLAPYPVQDVFGRTVYQPTQVDIDDALLEAIATKTGGRYFRATDGESLKQTYEQIDKMEKSKIEMDTYLRKYELYPYLAALSLALVAFESLLTNTVLRRWP